MKSLKIISPSFHGILDYIVDVCLICVPLIFDFKKVSSIVFWIPIGIGISNFIYSMLTVYSTSLVKIIPLKLHLLFDYLAGIILFSLAFIIPMEGFVKLFYITMGVGIILATSFTRTKESKNT